MGILKSKNKMFLVFIGIIIFIIAGPLFFYREINFNFTKEELKFIKDHPKIVLAPDPDYAPIEFINEDGEFKGIAAEYINWINNNTDLNIIVKKYESWDRVIDAVKNKKVDLLGGVAQTNNRDKFLLFSDSYIKIPILVVSNGSNKIENIENLKNVNVGVIKNSGNHDLLIEKYPMANLIPIKNIDEALNMVSTGKIEVFVGSSAQISYYTNKNKITNLEIINKMGYTYDMHFAVRDDFVQLQSILDKIIIQIPTEDRSIFLKKWINLNDNRSIFKNETFQKMFFVLISIIILSLIMGKLLKKQVKTQTLKIQVLNKNLKNELKDKEEMLNEVILSMTNLIELHDSYTKGHSYNVAKLSKNIAEKNNMKKKEVDEVYISALLHDLGKALIPLKIINKESKLTEDEYNIIRKHPELGYGILKDMKKFEKIAINALHHHERYDGEGYPKGLKGLEIPVASRIIAIADTYDTLTTDRPYQCKYSHNHAYNEIIANSGSQFDPELVEIFKTLEK